MAIFNTNQGVGEVLMLGTWGRAEVITGGSPLPVSLERPGQISDSKPLFLEVVFTAALHTQSPRPCHLQCTGHVIVPSGLRSIWPCAGESIRISAASFGLA